MSLEAQLSAWGLLAALATAIVVWLAAVWLGDLLQPAYEGADRTLDGWAGAGPWGLLFLVGVPAAVISRGTSALAIVPLMQIGVWLDRRGPRPRAAAEAPRDSGRIDGPRAWAIGA